MYVCDVHVLQRCHQMVRRDICPLVIKPGFQKPVYKQCGIAYQEMCPDPFRQPVVHGVSVKVRFYEPETVFDLVSFLGGSVK